MSLLIVDDNEELRGVIREIVRDMTDEVLDCADGAEALDQYARHRPEWVLMDLSPGDRDGLEATRRIRDLFPEARIVIVTDHDEPELRREALAAGAEHCVAKEDLLSLRRIVGRA